MMQQDAQALDALDDLMTPHIGAIGGLLSALHAVQARYGHLPAATTARAAHLFNLSQAEVRGFISFYHDFRAIPAGRTVVRVCTAEACQAAGSAALVGQLTDVLGIAPGETRADGAVTLEPVACLGLCSVAPALMLGDALIACAGTPDRLAAAVARVAAVAS